MDATSPYQIRYAALQTRILAFQTTLFDFLQLYSKSPSIFDNELASTTTQQLEHNYHTLIAEINEYQQQIGALEATSTTLDNSFAPHMPLSHSPHHSVYASHDTSDYDIDLRAFNGEEEDIELTAVLEQLSSTDVRLNQHPYLANIPLSTPTGIPHDVVPLAQQALAQTLAKIFNLTNPNLALPLLSHHQGSNIPLPTPQPTATQGALLHSLAIVRRLTVLTMQCDRLSYAYQTIALAPQ